MNFFLKAVLSQCSVCPLWASLETQRLTGQNIYGAIEGQNSEYTEVSGDYLLESTDLVGWKLLQGTEKLVVGNERVTSYLTMWLFMCITQHSTKFGAHSFPNN